MASGTSDLQRDLGGATMQAVLGSLLTAGYALSVSRAIAASPEAQQITEQTQASLQLSFVSAEAIAERYPQYADEITGAAREAFLSGANWAYLAAIIASFVGAAIVWTRFPGKQGESDLLEEYAEQDSGAPVNN
jgi:hypothetical protein